MAWSWSHTEQAYADAYDNLGELPVETLREIWAEWLATDTGFSHPDADYSGFSPSLYEQALATGHKEWEDPEASHVLPDLIWEQASEQATCDNGGFNAWMCPHGCGPHCVTFDRESADTLA